MIVVMESRATREQINDIVKKIQDAGLSSHISAGVERTIIGVVGDSHTKELLRQSLEAAPGAGRGGHSSPPPWPSSSQCREEEGLRSLAEARAETGLPVVTEAMDVSQLMLVIKYADMVQIGGRNMQNHTLPGAGGG